MSYLKVFKFKIPIQGMFAIITNSYLVGFFTGTIYSGDLKAACLPGLNCYSCPGALGSCPIGALQVFTGSRGAAFPLYIVGFLTVIGAFFGRFVCGFLCPFGLFQDLLYKVPFLKKIGTLPGDRLLKYLPYGILVIFVIIMPIFAVDATGLGSPAFCKIICPSGTLGAGIPLVLTNESIVSAIGLQYWWKITLLTFFVILSVIAYRPFCRYICPLGAVYGLFNPIAFLGFEIDKSTCTECGVCKNICKWNIDVNKSPNSWECIRCGKCITGCSNNAIVYKGFKKRKQNILVIKEN